MGDISTTASQGGSPLAIHDIDSMRTAGKNLVTVGADVASTRQRINLGEAVAEAMPNSALAKAAPAAADAFKATLASTAKWPTDVGGKILDAVSAITGQDERAAAGLKQDGQGDDAAGSGSGGKTGSKDESSAGKIDTSQVTYGKGGWASGDSAVDGYISQALDKRGITDPAARKRWTEGYKTMIRRESSGNPMAVNTTDSNATGAPVGDGNPANCSRGLAQCIPSTFAAYHQAGTSTNIYDPVANIAASMNYVQARYGVSADGSNLASNVQQANSAASAQGY